MITVLLVLLIVVFGGASEVYAQESEGELYGLTNTRRLIENDQADYNLIREATGIEDPESGSYLDLRATAEFWETFGGGTALYSLGIDLRKVFYSAGFRLLYLGLLIVMIAIHWMGMMDPTRRVDIPSHLASVAVKLGFMVLIANPGYIYAFVSLVRQVPQHVLMTGLKSDGLGRDVTEEIIDKINNNSFTFNSLAQAYNRAIEEAILVRQKPLLGEATFNSAYVLNAMVDSLSENELLRTSEGDTLLQKFSPVDETGDTVPSEVIGVGVLTLFKNVVRGYSLVVDESDLVPNVTNRSLSQDEIEILSGGDSGIEGLVKGTGNLILEPQLIPLGARIKAQTADIVDAYAKAGTDSQGEAIRETLTKEFYKKVFTQTLVFIDSAILRQVVRVDPDSVDGNIKNEWPKTYWNTYDGESLCRFVSDAIQEGIMEGEDPNASKREANAYVQKVQEFIYGPVSKFLLWIANFIFKAISEIYVWVVIVVYPLWFWERTKRAFTGAVGIMMSSALIPFVFNLMLVMIDLLVGVFNERMTASIDEAAASIGGGVFGAAFKAMASVAVGSSAAAGTSVFYLVMLIFAIFMAPKVTQNILSGTSFVGNMVGSIMVSSLAAGIAAAGVGIPILKGGMSAAGAVGRASASGMTGAASGFRQGMQGGGVFSGISAAASQGLTGFSGGLQGSIGNLRSGFQAMSHGAISVGRRIIDNPSAAMSAVKQVGKSALRSRGTREVLAAVASGGNVDRYLSLRHHIVQQGLQEQIGKTMQRPESGDPGPLPKSDA